ncbi:MAG TPA: carboxypeptidase-like regulatory domain-containing protein [Acidimicrobiia bacterium]
MTTTPASLKARTVDFTRMIGVFLVVTGLTIPALAEDQSYETLAPVGALSGQITDEQGAPVPQGRVDLFHEDGTYLGFFVANSSGFYTTTSLEPGTYYLLLYNGDDDFYIDYFPQWYGGATLLRPERAVGVTVTTGPRSGIDARLVADYEDMYDSVFFESIVWMQFTGITQGCAPELYCVDDPVTRGQMAAFLVRALFYSDDGGGDLYIDDDDSVFEGAIDRLGTAGVTQGCNPPANDRFCPDRLVTRGQMAAFLVRALFYTDDGGGDLFVDDDDSVFEGAIDRLRTAGVTLGCNPPTNDRFCPDDPVTRGQMAAFLKRALEDFYTLSGAAPSLASPPMRAQSH